MMQGRLNSADRVARAIAMVLRSRRLGTPEAAAEADITLAGLTRIELKEVMARAGDQAEARDGDERQRQRSSRR